MLSQYHKLGCHDLSMVSAFMVCSARRNDRDLMGQSGGNSEALIEDHAPSNDLFGVQVI
jgi:hypothetical protein